MVAAVVIIVGRLVKTDDEDEDEGGAEAELMCRAQCRMI